MFRPDKKLWLRLRETLRKLAERGKHGVLGQRGHGSVGIEVVRNYGGRYELGRWRMDLRTWLFSWMVNTGGV